MSNATDKTFINGMLAEKARIATTLLSDLLAEMPDDLLKDHQKTLSDAAKSLLEVQHDLRRCLIPDPLVRT